MTGEVDFYLKIKTKPLKTYYRLYLSSVSKCMQSMVYDLTAHFKIYLMLLIAFQLIQTMYSWIETPFLFIEHKDCVNAKKFQVY